MSDKGIEAVRLDDNGDGSFEVRAGGFHVGFVVAEVLSALEAHILSSFIERLEGEGAKRAALDAFNAEPNTGFQRSFEAAIRAAIKQAKSDTGDDDQAGKS